MSKIITLDNLRILLTKLKEKFQEKLISGTSIKTVNGNSLLGSGDVTIDSGKNFVGKLGSYSTYLSGFLNALSVKGEFCNFPGINKDAASVGDLFIVEAKAADTHDYYVFLLECITPNSNNLRGQTIYSYITHDYELLSNKIIEITSKSTNTQYPSAKATYNAIKVVKDKVDEIELFKFPNATIFGLPTIQQGQISNFSAINYLQFPFIVDFKDRTWTIDLCFTATNVTGQHNIFDSLFGLAFAIRDCKLVIAGSSNGTGWDLGEYSSENLIEINKTYHVKISYDLTTYKVAVKEELDETDYVEYISFNSQNRLYPKTIIIGKASDNNCIFEGTINFNHCFLTIANKVVWQGMDDAGLATRMAVNMNNIDEEGKQVIVDIVNEVIKPNYDFRFIYLGNGNADRTFLLTNQIGYILGVQSLATVDSFFYDMFKMVRNVAATDYPTITTLQDMYIDDVFTPANTVIKNDSSPDFEGRKIRLIKKYDIPPSTEIPQ